MKNSNVLSLTRASITIMILGFILTAGNAYPASIININALTTSEANPVIMLFPSGTYDVTPIGISDGGAYNAWNPWGGVVSLPQIGWVNKYFISSSQFSAYGMGSDSIHYTTDLLALANAAETSFTLTENGYVKFFIYDNYYPGNIGGMSLLVNPVLPANPVPIPPTLWLLGSCLIGLLGIRRKISK